MVVKVDPFLLPIPKKLLRDPELRPFFEYFVRWAHDIWLRTGGGDDAISELQIGELYEAGSESSRIAELENDLEEIYAQLNRFDEIDDNLEEVHAQLNRFDELDCEIEEPLDNSDRFDEIESKLNEIQVSTEDNEDRFSDIENDVATTFLPPDDFENGIFFSFVEVATGDTALTIVGNQIVDCNNTGAADVTLDTAPIDGQQAIIKRWGTGIPTLKGTIDGVLDPTIGSIGDVWHIRYTNFGNKWGVI